MNLRTRIAGWLIVLAASTSFCWACNVPVFRYALDHWRPDSYQAILYHRGQLSHSASLALQLLTAEIESKRINLLIKQIDVAELDSSRLPESVASLDLQSAPQLAVHYPIDLQIPQPIATMPLDENKLKELMDSPVRRELIRRLAAGQSAVFVFVASGNEQVDQAARSVLESELRTLQSTLELPKLTDDPEDKVQGGPPLRIEFSVLDLGVNDPAEWGLRGILLGSEPDLSELNEPLVFPVFGCGRALWPLVGAGINSDNLRESATFVSGACSCQVKEQNPGFDLLMNASWEQLLPWTSEVSTGHNLGTSVEVAETVPIPSGSNMSKELLAMGLGSAATGQPDSQAPVEAATGSGSMTMIVIAVVAVAAVAIIAMLMTRKRAAVS